MVPARTSRVHLLGLLAILVLAAYLRSNLTDSGVPGVVFQRTDERHYMQRVVEFLHGDWSTTYFVNPTFFMYVLLAATVLAGLVGMALGVYGSWGAVVLDVTLDPWLPTLVGRALVVALGVASVLLVERIGRRLYSPRAGLVAALALAVDQVHVGRSTIAGNEVPMTFLVLCFFLALLRYLERPSARRHAAAGLLLGLAVATKYNAGVHVVTLGVATLLAARGTGSGERSLQPSFLAGFAGAAAGFLLGAPCVLVHPRSFWEDFTHQASLLHGGFGPRLPGWSYYVREFARLNSGLPFAVLSGLGLVWAAARLVRRRDRTAALLLAASLPCYLALGSGIFSQMRFLLPAIPFVLLLGAALLDRVAARATERWGSRAAWSGPAVAALALLLVAPHTWRRLQHVGERDPRGALHDWMAGNLDREEPFLVGYGTETTRFFRERSDLDPAGLDPASRARLAAHQAKAFHALPLRPLLTRNADLGGLREALGRHPAARLVFSLWAPQRIPRRSDPREHADRLLWRCRQLRQACPYWREAIDGFLAELPVAGLVVAPDGRHLLLVLELPRGG